MLERWLGEIALRQFLDESYLKQPFYLPGRAREFVRLLEWDVTGRILTTQPRPDVLVVKAGRFLPGESIADAREAKGLFTRGVSFVIRKGECHDPELARLAADFSACLRGPTTIQLFYTPANQHGFGWHYDAEEVFILQTAGVKEYFLRENTVNPRPNVHRLPRDMQFERETSPIMTCTLAPGDWLYLPGGWWHVARAVEDSLSISLGVLSEHARREAA